MISIIIPTLNEEKVIKSTLLSLRRAIKTPYEVIVSDGGSSDATVQIAKRYADKVVEHTASWRQTIAAGRNAGAAMASGDYLVFLDADCQLENPDIFLRTTMRHFKENIELVAITTSLRIFADTETLEDRFFSAFINFKSRVMNNYFAIGESVGEFQMIRKEAFRSIGGFNVTLVAAEDFDMFQRLSKIGRILYEPTLTVFHSGRRAHAIGWPKLISLWFLNAAYVLFFKNTYSKEWEELR